MTNYRHFITLSKINGQHVRRAKWTGEPSLSLVR